MKGPTAFFLLVWFLCHAACQEYNDPDPDLDRIHEWLHSLDGKMRGGSDGSSAEEASGEAARRPVHVTLSEYGRVQGVRTEGVDFFGNIPYAAPPVGNLRFAPPEPPLSWSPAILDGTSYGHDCWQVVDPTLNPIRNRMSEDCLTLNVFVPAGQATRKKQLLPVMVWFHGGAFQQGGANRPEYNGKSLVERELLVVSVNYRLGALGFLVSSSDGLYGNYGLMDQRAALDWVHNNIRDFGGDPHQITLFGESAGAIMIGLHLMMRPTHFHRVILQSNAMGYTFRSATVADFIGEAFKRNVDCRDLGCLRSERVEDLIKAQSSLMGVPRSVGDFFTWGPTITQQTRFTFGASDARAPFRSNQHVFRNHPIQSPWAVVNVSQPLEALHLIPDNIPIIIGTNKHEGEMFVYSAFPAPMPKAVYWMFVGALFRDSAGRVLKHYRGYVDQVEREAEALAKKQQEEEENKQYYLENQEQLESEYELLLAMNETRRAQRGVRALVESWSRGGAILNLTRHSLMLGRKRSPAEEKKIAEDRALRRMQRKKERALKKAAKVAVDFRPLMSRIIDDYLFRCPSWHYAHRVSQNRVRKDKDPDVYLYRFSQPTHVAGFKYCWGKSCHTAELPYVFHSMDVIRANYSTLGLAGQQDAPSAPEYPYTATMEAFRGAIEAYQSSWESPDEVPLDHHSNHTHAFQRIVNHFFGDYFKEDADEEIASDMVGRWAMFAKTGDPNYEDSRAEWLPWRNMHQHGIEESAKESTKDNSNNKYYGNNLSRMFSAHEDDDDMSDDEDEEPGGMIQVWSNRKDQRAIRRRVLAALEFEVVEEDLLRTELRRVVEQPENDLLDKAFLTSRFLFRNSLRMESDSKGFSPTLRQQVMQIAQDSGFMGIGMAAGDDARHHSHYQEWGQNRFFPEIFELKWPPEGRLIERDCTCDMWDKIRYRY